MRVGASVGLLPLRRGRVAWFFLLLAAFLLPVSPAIGEVFSLVSTTDYHGPGGLNDMATGVAVDSDGNIVVAGFEFGTAGWPNWRVRKYDAALSTLLASTDYDGPGSSEDAANGVVIDGSGDVVVAGFEVGSTGGYNWRIRKYDATLATLLASTDYDGSGHGWDTATSLAVDGSGNVVVAGEEVGGDLTANWRVRRYDATLTTLLASTDYTGPGNGNDTAYAIAVDGSGNVVVAGCEAGMSGGWNWRLRKYDPTLTTLLGSTEYDGPGNGYDIAYAIAVDGSGNVVVAGYETGVTGGWNWRVRKYDPTLTTLLASTDYNGPGNGNDTAYAIAVDGSGNVVVAGEEVGGDSTANWRIRKYDAMLTTLLASTDYNGQGNYTDEPCALAVDGRGKTVVAGFQYDIVDYQNWRIRVYAMGSLAAPPPLPPLLTSPGVATDKNVIEPAKGEFVLARIAPVNGSPIVVRVFTASGRLVRTLRNLTAAGSGQYVVAWNGRNEDEFVVARGVYLVHVRGGGLSETVKLVVK